MHACTCYMQSFLSLYEEILHCQFPLLEFNQLLSQIPTQDKVQQTSASLSREWMPVNTVRKTKTQVREEWKKAKIRSLCGIQCCKFACWYISPIAQASSKCMILYSCAYI